MEQNNKSNGTEKKSPRGRKKAVVPPEGGSMNIVELKEKPIAELAKLARELNIEGAAGLREPPIEFSTGYCG